MTIGRYIKAFLYGPEDKQDQENEMPADHIYNPNILTSISSPQQSWLVQTSNTSASGYYIGSQGQAIPYPGAQQALPGALAGQSWILSQQAPPQPLSQGLPVPIGQISEVTYRDPLTGSILSINIDIAYIPIFLSIMGHSIAASPHAKLVSAEFSLDEIGEAEQLIEEMEHAA